MEKLQTTINDFTFKTIIDALDVAISKFNDVTTATNNATSALYKYEDEKGSHSDKSKKNNLSAFDLANIAHAEEAAAERKAKRAAEGGIFTSPTFAMIGEAGPEAVIPLSNYGNDIGKSNEIIIENITINGVSGNPKDFAQEFAKELRRELKTF